MASSNPQDYNTDAWVRWEQYADRLDTCFAGRGPHPGEPPIGYREVYTVRHRHAPLPENRSVPAPAPAVPGAPGVPTFQGMRGVAMSEDAFGAFLNQGNHWATQFSRLAESLQPGGQPVPAVRPVAALAAAPPIPIAPRAHFNGRGRGYGLPRGGYRGRGSFRGGRDRAFVPPAPRGGGLLGRIDRNGLNTNGQRGGHGGGTHGRGKRSGRDRHDREEGPSRDNGALEARPEAADADAMDVDTPHAGGSDPNNEEDVDGERRSVSPLVSLPDEEENRGEEPMPAGLDHFHREDGRF